jgi:hypothetical protein
MPHLIFIKKSASPVSLTLLMLSLLLTPNNYLHAQWFQKRAVNGVTLGIFGAFLGSNNTIADGPCIDFRYNAYESTNSALSVSSNIKIGLAGEHGLGMLAIIVNSYPGNDFSAFLDLPLVVHYNVGLGSRTENSHHFGFYFGGGGGFTATGYTDSSNVSKGVTFFNYRADGGIRFNPQKGKKSGFLDLNFSMAPSFRKPIAMIQRPVLYSVTLSVGGVW